MITRRSFLSSVLLCGAAGRSQHFFSVALAFHSESAKAGAAFGVLEAQLTASLMGVAFSADGDSSAPLLTDLPPDGARLTVSTASIPRAPAHSFLVAATPEAHAASAVEWHPSLTRFGAEQLNSRFAVHTARSMDSQAWLAYIAVKIVVEGELRRGTRTLEESIERIRFDGLKGTPLVFVDRRLRQPLYIVRTRGGEEAVEEFNGPS
jgi:hypothetical protein